ncbi:hypothetical protein EIN_247430 [Entamoeba invadens IP1]|uniref:Uncharacterized protein n=1 Tax=Entamoeba invadens IP1 TaxID=370355 RepID=A0A0A1UGE5_ENTIV|nr:hypothetical protein EIN_247430 [Entamoeba invadens IP1]ELP94829.1 hypothetical protein EIN_247430 [Entamoeba invadens IP1]|eukprot:XP_004261600.1 hypothetical protein EIN_247430 [Entamoeba invadens IP1]
MERNDPIIVKRIENPADTIITLGQSTSSCQLQDDILLFGKKGLMTAVKIEGNKLVVLHQIHISGSVDQMWYNHQNHLLICLVDKKLESFQVDLTKRAAAEVFKRVETKNIKNVGNYECFSTFLKGKILFIAAVDTKKKSGITLIESKTDGIFYKETKVWNSNERIVGCTFVNQNLAIIFPSKIQIIRFFGQSEVVAEKNINPFKSKPRFLPLQLAQVLTHVGNDVYLIEENTINTILNEYPIINISKMSPFIFFMQEFAQNKFYVCYRLEPLTQASEKSDDFSRNEYFKQSYMHEDVPVFINTTLKQLIYFSPNPSWYESAVQNGFYKSAIDFITLLGNNADSKGNSEQYKSAAYTLWALKNIVDFYKNDESRNVQNVVQIINNLKMGNVSAKNLVVFLVLFIFQDFFPDLYERFLHWFNTTKNDWKKDMLKTFPEKLMKKLQDMIESVLQNESEAVEKSRKKKVPLKIETTAEHTKDEIIQTVISCLMAMRSQIVGTSKMDKENEDENEMFFTAIVVISYYSAPHSKAMVSLMKETTFLNRNVILEMLKEPTDQNRILLIEYYVAQNHLNNIFEIKNITYNEKRMAVIRLLENKSDAKNIMAKVNVLINEKIREYYKKEGFNGKVQKELSLIFKSEVITVEDVCNGIASWEFSDMNDGEIAEMRSRLAVLFVIYKMGLSETNKARYVSLYVSKVLEHLRLAEKSGAYVEEEYLNRFVDVVESSPECVKDVKEKDIPAKFYKVRCVVGVVRDTSEPNSRKKHVLEVMVNIVNELKKDSNTLKEIYRGYLRALVDYLSGLSNQNLISQSVTEESVCIVLYSQATQEVLKKTYDMLKSVNNLFAEIALLIFSLDDFKNEYQKIHQEVVMSQAPGKMARFVWDLADPKENPIAGDEESIRQEIENYKSKEDIKNILEGVICYLEKKSKQEGTLLTDCYLKYLQVIGDEKDEVSAAEKLMEMMQNNTVLQKHIGTYFNTLPWRLRCRIRHEEKYKGLLEYYQVMTQNYSATFVDDTFKALDDYLKGVDENYTFDGSNESIAKSIRLIRQCYRPFNKMHPAHVGAEVVMHCVCQVNNLNTNTSPLLAFLIHVLLERNTEFENPFPVSFALRLFGRFYPIIPLKFIQKEFEWLGIDLNEWDEKIEVEGCLFSKMLDGVENLGDLNFLLPAIYSTARRYFYDSMYFEAVKTVMSNATRRYELVDRRTVCCKCRHRVAGGQAFVLMPDGQLAHEQCFTSY